MRTKKQVIDYLKKGGIVRVVTSSHKSYNKDRKAEKVQTNGVRLDGGSWLYFNDIDPEWVFDSGFKINDGSEDGFIEYVFMEMGRFE